MLNKYFFIISCLVTTLASGQGANRAVRISHYLFDSLSKAKVQVKSGTSSEEMLNYNTLTGEMLFENEGRLLAIANPSEVDTVFVRGRKFIPVDHKFYEVLTNTTAPLLMEFVYKIEENGAPVGYGNASATTNATSYSSMISTNTLYELKLPDNYTVIPGFVYWIRKNNKYQKVASEKQLVNIFPEKKEFIKQFIKKNHTNFSERKDIILLVQQIEQ